MVYETSSTLAGKLSEQMVCEGRVVTIEYAKGGMGGPVACRVSVRWLKLSLVSLDPNMDY